MQFSEGRGGHVLKRPDIDAVWIAAAERLGFQVVRTSDAYATADGRGTIGIGTDETLDPDDSLAQLVFHELCHAIVEGEDGLRVADWGLDNTTDADRVREEACLRVQAFWADHEALRDLMTPTTISRVYYQALPLDPLAPTDDAAAIARTSLNSELAKRFWHAIAPALAATAGAVRAKVRST